MQFYSNNITNPAGTALAGISVRVQHTDGSDATIYSDNGVTPATNPLTTDGMGSFGFYAANGRYQLAISGNRITPPYTVRDILLYDPASDETDLVGKASNADLANAANGYGVDKVANAAKKVTSIASLKALRVPQGSDAQTVIVDCYSTTGDQGGGLFYWNATSTAADDGGITLNPTGNTGAGRWVRHIMGQSINVRWFGAVGDGVTDDTAAIQAAINYANSSSTRKRVNLVGNHLASSTLTAYTNIELSGETKKGTTLTAAAVFTGTALLKPPSGTIQDMSVHDLILANAGTTLIRAFDATGNSNTTRNYFSRITLNGIDGFYLSSTTGFALENVIEDCYAFNTASQQMDCFVYKGKGDRNRVRQCKISISGSTNNTNPFIYFFNGSENEVSNIFWAGGVDSKPRAWFESEANTRIINYWNEETKLSAITAGVWGLYIKSSTGIKLEKSRLDYYRPMGIENSSVVIDTLSTASSSFDLLSMYLSLVGTMNDVVIETFYTAKEQDVRLVADINNGLRIKKVIASFRTSDANAAGKLPAFNEVEFLSAKNLLVNPSFEVGRYGWSFSSNPSSVEEYIPSQVGNGLMGHFIWSTAGGRTLTQNYAITSQMVGQVMTFVALVKIITASGNASLVRPSLSGAGTYMTSGGYDLVHANQGWAVYTFSFIPQIAGTISVGVVFDLNAGDTGAECFIDDGVLCFGGKGMLNSSTFGQVELNGVSVLSASAQPSSGTWKVGDVVINNNPTEQGTAGSKYVIDRWRCVTAGSPGTWLGLRMLTGN